MNGIVANIIFNKRSMIFASVLLFALLLTTEAGRLQNGTMKTLISLLVFDPGNSLAEKQNAVQLMGSVNSSTLYILYPVTGALIAGIPFCVQKNTDYLRFMMARVKIKSIILVYLITVLLMAFAVALFSTTGFMLSCFWLDKKPTFDGDFFKLFLNKWFVLLWLVFISAMLSLALASLWSNPYFVVSVPVLISYVLMSLTNVLILQEGEINGFGIKVQYLSLLDPALMLTPGNTGMLGFPVIFSYYAGTIVVSAAAAAFYMNRSLRRFV